MGLMEGDLIKCKKIGELKLCDEEWDRVENFLSLLAVRRSNLSFSLLSVDIITIYHQHADNAQQAFPSDTAATLHLAIPALEALHKAWSSRQHKIKYSVFREPLTVELAKLADYYKKSADCEAYLIAMRKYITIICVCSLCTLGFKCSIQAKRWVISRSIGVRICKIKPSLR